ncbi:MAG: hypothetical protein QOD75_1824 [Blastocatellia bacterium]|jgi:hypothetical protein|nr:hypothetical protein [Blastocatellia bacterium]
MLLLMALIGAANILWAERLTVNGGFGWDGLWYAGWVRDFYGSIFVHGVPEYYVQRILPSAIVHYGLRALRAPLSDQNILRGFDAYNFILVLFSVYLWGRIADRLSLRSQGKWLGFAFLFLNYAILKNNFYHSTLTDTTAFTLGLLTFYFFVSNKAWGLLLVMIAGAFTWPTVPYMAALLFIFPFEKTSGTESEAPQTRSLRLATFIAAAVCFITLLLYGFLLRPAKLAMYLYFLGRALRIDFALMYLSLAAVMVYLFFGLRRLLADADLFNFKMIFGKLWKPRVAIVIALMLALKLAIHFMANGEAGGWPFKSFLIHSLLVALTEPVIFLVAHAVYYGPAILLLVLFWRPFCEALARFGPGMRMALILNFLLSINAQSRYQINIVSTFFIILVCMLDRAGLKFRSLPVWVLLCLFYSKMWYTFNTGPQVDDETMDSLLNFPLQHYFMSSGPWMSHQMYLIQGGIVLLTAILLWFLMKWDLLGMGVNYLARPSQTHKLDSAN